MKESQAVLYDAMLYGFGIVLSKYDAVSSEVLVRDLGRYIKEYLNGKGVHFKDGATAEESMQNIVATFAGMGFVDEGDIKPAGDEGVAGLPVK